MVSDSLEGPCNGDADYEFLRDVPRVKFYRSGEFSPLGAPDPRYTQEKSRFMAQNIVSYGPYISQSFKNAVPYEPILKNGYGEYSIAY